MHLFTDGEKRTWLARNVDCPNKTTINATLGYFPILFPLFASHTAAILITHCIREKALSRII